MDIYILSLLALVFSALGQTFSSWLAVRRFLAGGERRQCRGWLAAALLCAVLALRDIRALELALHTGLYDAPQALLSVPTTLFLFFVILAFRWRV